MSDTTKLIESMQNNFAEIVNNISLNEDEEINQIYCDTFNEFKSEVEKYGGLYGFVGEKYYTMPITLLKELALNAIYELNNDNKVISDIKERIYTEDEDNINEDTATELNNYNKDIQTILNGLEEIRNKLTTEEGNKILDDYIYSSVSNAINDLDLEVDNDLIG